MTQTPGQQMAGTVLDLIDGALWGDTSGDAMRWSPEPDKAPAVPALQFADFVVRFDPAPITQLFQQLGEQLKPYFAAMERLAADLQPPPRRLAALGRAYHRRLRARSRRRR